MYLLAMLWWDEIWNEKWFLNLVLVMYLPIIRRDELEITCKDYLCFGYEYDTMRISSFKNVFKQFNITDLVKWRDIFKLNNDSQNDVIIVIRITFGFWNLIVS